MIITRDEKHRYLVDGQRWPGVTTIIGSVINKPFLNDWRERVGKREADEIRDHAAAHGTFVHTLASLHAEGEVYIPMGEDRSGEAALQVHAFKEWWDTYVDELVGTEIFIAHPTYHYAGALDFLVRMAGDKLITLVDIKSGKTVGKEARAQTAAYREAALATILKEMGEKTCRRGVLHIPPGDEAGRIRFIPHDKHREDFQAFLSCMYLFNWLKN